MDNKNQRETPHEFYDQVDRFIGLANELGSECQSSRVSATLMYAAARYNAFNWLNRKVELEQNVNEAVEYYRNQYEEMLRENIETLMNASKKTEQ